MKVKNIYSKYNIISLKLSSFFVIVLFVLILSSIKIYAAGTDDFMITVKTDNIGTSTDTQFTIPTTGTGYNYNVDCDNDGSDEATAQTGDYTCNYGVSEYIYYKNRGQ